MRAETLTVADLQGFGVSHLNLPAVCPCQWPPAAALIEIIAAVDKGDVAAACRQRRADGNQGRSWGLRDRSAGAQRERPGCRHIAELQRVGVAQLNVPAAGHAQRRRAAALTKILAAVT